MIDPQDVIRRYTVEELRETAEAYYRVVSDPTPLMSKPFAFLHEAPQILQNLGFLLAGLHLGKTMSVLDFGAGTCWLSRYLAQLSCQTICCDASRTALEIGKRLFHDYPLIGTAVYKPAFLWFDGHTIDLPAGSVDRIVTFDAFHHIPNQAEVISEFGRVLRRGGIAGFAEPGRRHSQSPQSQYEMHNHKVLENDIKVDEIFSLARPAGFTHLRLKVVLDDMEISLRDYDVLFDGGTTADHERERLKSEIWNQTYNGMSNRSIFFLHKGPLVRDSRSHSGLAHVITTDKSDFTLEQGRPLRVSFSIRNTGDASWLNTNTEIFGIVRLASHLYDSNGDLISVDHSRHDLPVSVPPGEAIDMTVDVPLPGPGSFRLAFDLVAEGVIWFENAGSRPVHVTVRVN